MLPVHNSFGGFNCIDYIGVLLFSTVLFFAFGLLEINTLQPSIPEIDISFTGPSISHRLSDLLWYKSSHSSSICFSYTINQYSIHLDLLDKYIIIHLNIPSPRPFLAMLWVIIDFCLNSIRRKSYV